jgi:ubiquinol-cytochrome c reductase cytochrome c1 subunit
MFRKIAVAAVSVLALSVGGANAAGEESHVEDIDFAHEGPFGAFDQFQLQRGLQVYTEVCSGCHGLKYVPIRTLSDQGGPGIPEDQVRAYATQFTVTDKETLEDREGKPTDNFPANTGAGAPDLSLMAKARAGFHGPYGTGINQMFRGMGGPEYIVSILTGYTGEEKEEFGSFFYANTAFPGGWIAMAPPLSDDQVTYADGHPATVHHMAEDVASFLMWAAEPQLMARKNAGFVGVMFLIILSTLLYLTNKRIWSGIKHRNHA